MPKKDKDNRLKSPRTVQELAPWLAEQFRVLGEHIDALNSATPASSPPEGQEAKTNPSTARQTLVKGLAEAAAGLEALLQSGPPARSQQASTEPLARALLLTGNGEKFEPCVQAAIRNYCSARREVLRYTYQVRLPKEVREDVLAGFKRVLADRRADLQHLAVRVEEVGRGSPLDLDFHRVEQKLATDDPDRLNTVYLCLTPVFHWISPHGVERLEPARVVAYTDFDEAPSTRPREQYASQPPPSSLFGSDAPASPFSS